MTIKVLIVDDSSVVRQVMQDLLLKHRDIEVIGTAPDPIFAMSKMQNQWPDVILLDIEMPRMDGITFLKQIMSTRPTPVVICSTLTERGADITIEAMAAGAISIITKPTLGLRDFLQESANQLTSAIREAAMAKVGIARARPSTSAISQERMNAPKLTADAIMDAPVSSQHLPTTEKIIALGTSTGGTQALELVLTALPATCPGLVIVQHMPEKFTQSFANRLNSLCAIEVFEAKNNDRIVPGRALIAPGGKHMLVKRSGAQYYVEVIDGPLVSRHRPSVDVLFRSVAKNAGRNAIGIIMTGMGDDGARGIKEMHNTGAVTYAQDEASCVVFGMPKEAIALGGIKQVVSLDKISQVIEQYGR
ncbi:chemotaxis response regulator protein-glutamate methylesterase [Chitinibacter sp. GC72]|uniref:protein-glutamate methylesterase/protein-glutamine glutaminase n=1 Tax=Chitinibacter sp. GC72 TaxID=1526917 RepID=UPI0012F91014|nr:chemotaxis response regulator protein-glutamate methylesterase [Chitinibacter sp. GC72]